MSEFLTQEEIDALLNGVDEIEFDGESAQPAAASPMPTENRIKRYDFSRREKITGGHLPELETIFQRFIGFFEMSLSRFTGSSVEIEKSAIQIQPFSEFLQALPSQAHLRMARFSPLRGRAVIAIEPRLVFSITDHYFGGGAQPQPSSAVESRPLSPAMKRVVARFLELMARDLKSAWMPVMDVVLDYADENVEPPFDKIVASDEIAVISTIHVRMNAGGGDLIIVMPNSMIEQIRRVMVETDLTGAENDTAWQSDFRQRILRAEVTAVTRLSEKQMTFGQIMQLRIGDVIPIDKPEKLELSVQGVPLYEGIAGVSKEGRNALRITARVGP
ncbi:MAG: flagellar motor switch protein FliM [Gammaproteobacteria bacterium]